MPKDVTWILSSITGLAWMMSSWRTPAAGSRTSNGGIFTRGRRADDAVGEALEPREVQHAVHAVPADGLLAHLLRQSLSAHGKSPGGPGAELHRVSRGRRRRHDDFEQRARRRRGSALR